MIFPIGLDMEYFLFAAFFRSEDNNIQIPLKLYACKSHYIWRMGLALKEKNNPDIKKIRDKLVRSTFCEN